LLAHSVWLLLLSVLSGKAWVKGPKGNCAHFPLALGKCYAGLKLANGLPIQRIAANDESLAVKHFEDGILDVVTANLDGRFQRDANDGPADLLMREVCRTSGNRKIRDLFLLKLSTQAGVGGVVLRL